MPPSAAQTGTARTRSSGRTAAALLAKPRLAERGRELGGVLDSNRRRRTGDLAVDGVAHILAPRSTLERLDVEIRDTRELVLRAGPERRGRREERGGERLDLAVSRRDPRGALELRKPADVADDERLAERKRSQDGAGRLAHRRGAQRDEHVAGCHQRPEPRLRNVLLAEDPFRAEALEHGVEVVARRDRADKQEAGALREQPERLQELRNTLRGVQVAEAADELRAVDPDRFDRGRRPGGMRNHVQRAVVAEPPHTRRNVLRVDDQRG